MKHDTRQPFPFTPDTGSDEDRYRSARNVTLLGAVANTILAAAKIVVGFVGHSQALIADGVHSLSDLASDAMVLVAAKHGSRDADEGHPYGHARIETAMTVALGLVLLAVAGGIMLDAASRLFDPERLLMPGPAVIVAALLSVVVKEALYHYTLRVAKRTRSNLLRANAWHHRSDAVSSIVVIIGVAGTMAGLSYLDAIAAIGVGFMVAKIGWELAWHSVRELVDTALDADQVARLSELILSVDGVHALHLLRTRRMGQDALADVHILVDPTVSVSEGHHISETVRSRLIHEVDEVQDVLVHIDPEDDEQAAPSINLPSRKQVLSILRERWAGLEAAAHIDRVLLHYLDGRLSVELYLPLSVASDETNAQRIAAALASPADDIDFLREIRVYYY